MKRHLSPIPALCLAILLFTAPGAAAREIVMVFGAGYPPFYMDGKTDGTDNNLESGMFIDFLQKFEREHPQYSIRKIRLPRARMDQWMCEGRAHAFSLNSSLFVSPGHGDRYVFSEVIWRTGDHLAVRARSKLKYSRPEDLAGTRLGVVFGNGYGPLDPLIASGHIRAQKVYRQSLLALMLEDGRIDAYPANRHVDPYLWKQEGFAPGTFRLLDKPLYEFDLGVQVCKGSEDFLNDLNAFIRKSRKNGFLEALAEVYISGKE
ncbi:substrate-binding periplasmic protein [Salidesulfovibrio onnuriiensis]|uniref:substrate-binding periplasmic protein n=1 Tax=Salidesulfovibrio onnuriiensis TaxID=2583823 RepID=UPI0011CCB084|nr:ABC transporter substrate-binding protein [Salidesulfovibrio onnuriiensis]